jgi:ribonuclease VapC
MVIGKRCARLSDSHGCLNHDECFSYALAAARDDSLLFKGEDFALSDVKVALR